MRSWGRKGSGPGRWNEELSLLCCVPVCFKLTPKVEYVEYACLNWLASAGIRIPNLRIVVDICHFRRYATECFPLLDAVCPVVFGY